MKTINCTLKSSVLTRILHALTPYIFFTVSDGKPNSVQPWLGNSDMVQPWLGNPDHLIFEKDGSWTYTHEYCDSAESKSDLERTIQLIEPIPLQDFPLEDPEFMKIFESARMPNVTLWVSVDRK